MTQTEKLLASALWRMVERAEGVFSMCNIEDIRALNEANDALDVICGKHPEWIDRAQS